MCVCVCGGGGGGGGSYHFFVCYGVLYPRKFVFSSSPLQWTGVDCEEEFPSFFHEDRISSPRIPVKFFDHSYIVFCRFFVFWVFFTVSVFFCRLTDPPVLCQMCSTSFPESPILVHPS